MDDAECPASISDGQGRSTSPSNTRCRFVEAGRNGSRILSDEIRNNSTRAFAQHAAIDVDPAHARVGREWNEVTFSTGYCTSSESVLLFRQNNDRAAFGGLVGETRQLRGVGQFLVGKAGERDEFDGLPISQSNRAGFVQEQRVHVA